MLLNAIRFKSYGDSEHSVWKFSQGSGKLARFICFSESDNTVRDMKAALKFLFSGQLNPRIVDVAAQITDDAGDTWIIERKPENLRLRKNGKQIDGKILSETLLGSLLDMDIEGSEQDRAEGVINLYELREHEDQVTAKLESKHSQALFRVSHSIRDMRSILVRRVSELLRQPEIQTGEQIIDLQVKAEPLFSSYREILRQRRTLLANSQSLEKIDPNLTIQLEKEIAVIKMIEAIALPLLDPAQSPKIIKDKHDRVAKDLEEKLAASSIRDARLPLVDLPWDKLTACLAKLEAFERVVQASEKAQTLFVEKVSGVQSDYVKVLEGLLMADSQITSELESCLSTLSLQIAKKPEVRKGISDAIVRFIKPTANVPVEEGEGEKQNRLEMARLAVDFALGRLGELHANLGEARHSIEQQQTVLREHHEALVHEYGKLKSLWQRLCKDHQLPEQMNLNELMKLCLRHVQLNELHRLREAYANAITKRKADLSQLKDLVTQFHEMSESQKDVAVDNHSILLAEAQGIIRYKNAKSQQLEKLKHALGELRSYQSISHNLATRESQIRGAWKKVFHDLAIPEVSQDDAAWSEVFALAHEIYAWNRLENLGAKPIRDNTIFSEHASDKPFTLYTATSECCKPSARLQIVRALDQANIRGVVMICVNDGDLADDLVKSGTGSGRKIISTTSRTNIATSAVAPGNARNEKVQHMLDLLQNKKIADSGLSSQENF